MWELFFLIIFCILKQEITYEQELDHQEEGDEEVHLICSQIIEVVVVT